MRISDWSSDVCSSDLKVSNGNASLTRGREIMKFGNSVTKGTAAGSSSVDTLIGRHTEVLGDIRFSGGLHIDGKVKGKVLTSGEKASSLSVSESGAIEGDVRVSHIVLNGTVIGDVHRSEEHTSELQSLMRISYAV